MLLEKVFISLDFQRPSVSVRFFFSKTVEKIVDEITKLWNELLKSHDEFKVTCPKRLEKLPKNDLECAISDIRAVKV